MKSHIFSLKMFLCEERRLLELLKLLEKRDKEVSAELIQELKDKGWDVVDMSSQLYEILCVCAVPKSSAQQKLMALECRENIMVYTRIGI